MTEEGLRERMEALADEFDAKGRRGSAHFGADVGDTIRLWIERDPRRAPDPWRPLLTDEHDIADLMTDEFAPEEPS